MFPEKPLTDSDDMARFIARAIEEVSQPCLHRRQAHRIDSEYMAILRAVKWGLASEEAQPQQAPARGETVPEGEEGAQPHRARESLQQPQPRQPQPQPGQPQPVAVDPQPQQASPEAQAQLKRALLAINPTPSLPSLRDSEATDNPQEETQEAQASDDSEASEVSHYIPLSSLEG